MGLPYDNGVKIWVVVKTKEIIAEDANTIDRFLAPLCKRTVAKATNAIVATPDTITRAMGAAGTPSKFSADAKTAKMYVPIPRIASILLFIDYLQIP